MSETQVDESRVNELLLRWEELCRDGQMVSAEELCQELGCDSPQLVENLDRRIREVVTVGRLMTTPANDSTLQMERGDGRPEPVPLPTQDEVIFSVGQYDYFKFLAKGGVGEVYAAGDKDFGRDVALKFIQRDQEEHPESKGQFLVEGEITARLEHPGIVPVYGCGYTSDGRPFHVMRLIRGMTLGDRIASYYGQYDSLSSSERRVRFRELLTRFISVCNTVAYAHNRGILHRDIKPDNVMLGQYGETLVVDWGLAQPIERSDAARSSGEKTLKPGSGISEEELCFAKGVVGTPCYMSPEQAEGSTDLTPATDIYSLGALLYRIITGETAVQGTHLGDILDKAKGGDFPPPRKVNPVVSRPLEAICQKAMSLRTADRYETALQLAEDVERWLADEKVSVYRETPPRRIARWARRHRTAAQSIFASLFLLALIAAAVSMVLAQSYRSERNSKEEAIKRQRDAENAKAREIAALEDTLRTTAFAVAENVSNNWEHRRSVLQRLARDKELIRLVNQWNDAEKTGNAQLKAEAAEDLHVWLNDEFKRELPVDPESLDENDEASGQFGNWFVNDRVGAHIARASVKAPTPEERSQTFGKNYSWRSYFNGKDQDYTKDFDIRLPPLKEGPYLGAVYVADQFNELKIPLSMPIKDPQTKSVIGVLGMATNIGHFQELQDMDVFLISLRDDHLKGTARGLILQHPRLKSLYAERDVYDFKFPRIDDQEILNRISRVDSNGTRDNLNTGLLGFVRNPLTGQQHRNAAYCPIRLSERWGPQVRGQAVWTVLVMRKETAVSAE